MFEENDHWTTTVLPSGTLELLKQTIVTKDGVEIARTNWRTTLNPGDSTDGYPDSVAAIASAVWTEDVIAAYQASLTDQP